MNKSLFLFNGKPIHVVLAFILCCFTTAYGQGPSNPEQSSNTEKSTTKPNDSQKEQVETQDEPQPKPFDLWNSKTLTGDWNGTRSSLKDDGVDLSFILTSAYQQNFKGGVNTHNAHEVFGDFRVNLSLDFDKMGLIPGGSFFIRGTSSFNSGIGRDVGPGTIPAWVFAGGDEEIRVDKWWYRQRLFDDRLEFRFGRLLTPVDLFDSNQYAQSPWDHFQNVNLLRNPLIPHSKTIGLYAKYWPSDKVYIQAAIMDPRSSGTETGFKTAFDGTHQYNVLWELGLLAKLKNVKRELPGRYRFGGWYRPGTRMKFENSLGGVLNIGSQSSDVGFYLSFDQMLWFENDNPKDKQGLAAFVRYGFAHRNVNRFNHFWSVGAQYQGLIPTRDKDVFAFGVARSIVSSPFRSYVNRMANDETIYELYYAMKPTPWLVITPDLQYITNPGASKTPKDVLIAGLRFKISF